MSTREELLESITESYLGSRDFNGVPIGTILRGNAETLGQVRQLIEEGRVDALFASSCINPAIKCMCV